VGPHRRFGDVLSSEGLMVRAFKLGPVREMILRIERCATIDNLQNYPAEVVEQLRNLLMEGVSARRDFSRKNFYDVEHTDRAFFIHLSPLTGKVILLAMWPLLASPFIRF
jgi:hypothetical protein